MITNDPNVRSVEMVATALGDLCNDLVLVGGCAASLLIDAPTAPPPCVTYDVDLIAVVTALRDYYALERQFAQRGFVRDTSPDAPICRWKIDAMVVDLMPTDARVLGFSNRWYAKAAASAMRVRLPSGTAINLIAAPAFLATKFEAFQTRGNADVMVSHDFEDIINVVEGRAGLLEEIAGSEMTMRAYLCAQFAAILSVPSFINLLPGLIAYDALHAQRVERVLKRMTAMAEMKTS